LRDGQIARSRGRSEAPTGGRRAAVGGWRAAGPDPALRLRSRGTGPADRFLDRNESTNAHRCSALHGPDALEPAVALSRRTAAAFARSHSLSTKAANSVWVMRMGSASCRLSQSRSSAVASAFEMSRASLLTISCGFRAGAQIPYQIGKSKPSAPASASGGTSGSRRERRTVLTPSATRPPS